MRDFVAIALILAAVTSLFAQPISIDHGATQAAIVIDLSSGSTLYEYDADRNVTPASLTKLFTTSAAIELLEPSTRIATKAFLLDNVLYVRGYCDPTLNSRHYTWHSVEDLANRIASLLASRNIRHITALKLDESYLYGSPYPSKHLWEDMGNYYGASPSAFNILDNTQVITLSSPSKSGELCSVVSVQPSSGPKPKCFVRSYTKQADSVYVYGDGASRYISGCMPCAKNDFKVKATLSSPSSVFASMLRDALTSHGIYVAASDIIDAIPSNAELLLSYDSPSVESIVKTTNHESDNLYAESLLLHLNKGESSSFDEAMAILSLYIERTTGQKANIFDGSGLCPLNTTTPRQVTSLLHHALTVSCFSRQYESSLAKAGIEGTLRRLGKGTTIEGNVKGKSGSMTGVLGYAGIFTSSKGRRCAFCIIINHSEEPNSSLRVKIGHWLENCIAQY